MKPHDDGLSLGHMLNHAREAVAMAAGRTREDLATDRMLELALTRLVEIIGEAATRVSHATQMRLTSIHGPKSSGCGTG